MHGTTRRTHAADGRLTLEWSFDTETPNCHVGVTVMYTGTCVSLQAFCDCDCAKFPDDWRPPTPVTSSAGAMMTSLAIEDDSAMTTIAGDADDLVCSPSSLMIVDLDSVADTYDGQCRRLDGDPDGGGSAPGRSGGTTLRVPTPSSWERYRQRANVSPSPRPQFQISASDVAAAAQEPSSAAGAADMKVIVLPGRRKDDELDRRSTSTSKKACSCGAAATVTAQVHAHNHHHLHHRKHFNVAK